MTDDRQDADDEMAEADVANGEGPPDDDTGGDPSGSNDTERRYGEDESPA